MKECRELHYKMRCKQVIIYLIKWTVWLIWAPFERVKLITKLISWIEHSMVRCTWWSSLKHHVLICPLFILKCCSKFSIINEDVVIPINRDFLKIANIYIQQTPARTTVFTMAKTGAQNPTKIFFSLPPFAEEIKNAFSPRLHGKTSHFIRPDILL